MFQELSDMVNNGVESAIQDYPIIIWQILATFMLLAIVGILFWKPITKFIENEEKETNKNLLESKLEKEKALDLKNKMQTEYDNLQNEMHNFKKQLMKETELEREKILNQANKEAMQKRSNLKIELANEIINQEEKIKQTIKDVAMLAASKILEEKLDYQKDEKLIDKIIDEIGESKNAKR